MQAAIPLMAAGAGMSFFSSLQEGKAMQDIYNARSQIDLQNAQFARRRAEVKAGLVAEQGEELLASQKADYAAAGVKVNTGAPVVVAAKTRADIMKDIGYIYEFGEQEARGYESSAEIERKMGKHVKEQSRWDAFSSLFSGAGNLALLGA